MGLIANLRGFTARVMVLIAFPLWEGVIHDEQRLTSHLFGISIPISDNYGRRDVRKFAACNRFHVLITNVNQWNWQVGVLPFVPDPLPDRASVQRYRGSGDQQLSTHGLNRFRDFFHQ